MIDSKKRSIYLAAAFAILATVLFISYSFLPLTAPAKDNSPDENSNRYFSLTYAKTGRLWSIEQLNFLAPGMIHPRSVTVQDEFLLPGGFLGLPVIYGGIARCFGTSVLPFLTALFALLGLAGFGLAVSRWFGFRFGVIAAVLLAVQPNWWYQSSRPFMPNVLFLSLTMMAAGFLWGRPLALLSQKTAKRPGRITWIDSLFAGILLGIALAVRPPEAYWLLLAGLSVIAVSGIRKYWAMVLALVAGTVVSALPFVFLNRAVYGSWLSSGYSSGLSDLPVESLPGGLGAKLIGPLQPYIFPLGFAPRTAIGHFWDFGLGLFSWWWVIVLATLLILAVTFLKRRKEVKPMATSMVRAIAVSTAVISIWLILFYGSWTVRDNPDSQAITVGSSYLRYWLPISVLSVLPVAWAINSLWKRNRFGPVFVMVSVCAIALVSGLSVFFAPQEGLVKVRDNLRKSDWVAAQVFELTPKGSIVVVDRSDKFIFPGRPVMYPLRSESTWQAIEHLTPRRGAIYYLGITLPQGDLDWLNTVKLPPMNLKINLVAGLGEESLYIFETLSPAISQ